MTGKVPPRRERYKTWTLSERLLGKGKLCQGNKVLGDVRYKLRVTEERRHAPTFGYSGIFPSL